MRIISFNKTILSIVSITSIVSSLAMAQLVPGPGHGGNGGHNPPPRYNPCDQPADPNCPGNNPGHGNPGHGNGGYPSNPGHGNGGYPSNPSYPSYPSNPSYPNDPYYPPSNPSYGSNIVRTVYLGRSVYDQTINLTSLVNLDQYDGYRVVNVTADTTPNSPYRTVAELVMNGYVYATEVNPGYQIYLSPYSTVRLNRYGSDVYLRIQGSTYIQQIRVELSRY